MSLLNRFVPREDFASYEDFCAHFTINVPKDFNFAYDIVDVYAREEPDRTAIVWCDDQDNHRTFTFLELKEYSDRAANVFRRHGIVKGDHVLLVLKKRPEFWFCLLALHKVGAIATPATHMLTAKDIEYRIQCADIRMIVCVASDTLLEHADEAHLLCGDTLRTKAVVGGKRGGWVDFSTELEAASPSFERPAGIEATHNGDTLRWSISPPAPPVIQKWSSTPLRTRWPISSPQNTGRTSRMEACISPWPTQAGQNRHGARFTGNG